MLDSILNIKVIEAIQPIGNLYIGKIDGNILYTMARADIRRITENDQYLGIQRDLDRSRVNAIKKYINTIDAAFPNSIILNLDSQYVVDNTGDNLIVKITQDTFSIIDGQHRLAGFEDGNTSEFELVVAIFIDLDYEQQAILFSTINSEQKKVDPSHRYNLESFSTLSNPRKVAREIALAFNMDKESPWYKKIKMTGKKDRLSEDGIITLKAFMDPILTYIYPDKSEYHQVRNKLAIFQNEFGKNVEGRLNTIFSYDEYENSKYIFWRFYVAEQKEVIYKILLNYFKVLSHHLKYDWGNKRSILTKTTGYNAIMYLFKDIYSIGLKNGNFSYEFFENLLEPIKGLDGKIDSDTFGASGEYAARRLYYQMKNLL